MCKNEYANATTVLVDAAEKTWDVALLDKPGYPLHLLRPLSVPGTVVGSLKRDVAGQTGFDCTVVLPPTHDTASAFLAVPAQDDGGVTISSGTWSLLGVEYA